VSLPPPGPTGLRPTRPSPFGARFALFGECLLAGVLVVVAALPVVTLLAALAAGCAHIRAHVDGETTTLRSFAGRVRSACPGSALLSVGVAGGFAVLAADLLVLRTRVPGGGAVVAVCVLAAAGLAVVTLRAAAGWSPGAAWRSLVRDAARRAATGDPAGSALLVMALCVLGVITWQLLPLAVPTLGCVVMAAVAVEHRYLRRTA
jgi:hypothetical protein